MDTADSADGGETDAAGRCVIRRLTEYDRPALLRLLDQDEAYALFLAGHLEYFSLSSPLMRYWGLFHDGQLVGALKLVGRRAALYAPTNVDVDPLARQAAYERCSFTMGRPDLVDAVLKYYDAQAAQRRDEHYLAGLMEGQPPVVLPEGVTARRAAERDLHALVDLYRGTEGFEQIRDDQLRRILAARISDLRTYVIEYHDRLLAGASTSAESAVAAMIGGVWTAPEARNRGYATAVVAALARELLEQGRHPYLFYLRNNKAAARVYHKNGFRVIGEWSVAYLSLDAVPRLP